MTTDPYVGAELTDDDLQGEIELVGDLVVAASASDGPLSQAEIDEVLGISSAAGAPQEGARSRSGRAWTSHRA